MEAGGHEALQRFRKEERCMEVPLNTIGEVLLQKIMVACVSIFAV